MLELINIAVLSARVPFFFPYRTSHDKYYVNDVAI